MDRGYRSGEILLTFMMIAFVSQTVMKNKYYSQEKNSYARRVSMGGECSFK